MKDSIMNTKEALKNWKAQLEQQKKFPNAHIYTNIKNQGVDMKELATKNPYLYEMFTRIFSGVETPETVQLWKNYKQAYEELEAQGLFKIKNVREKVMEKKINEFIEKVNGHNLVPLEELEEVVTEKKRKGEVSIQVEFNDYIHLLEKHYGINYRDFFGKFGKESVDYAKLLGMTKSEYDKYCRTKPSEDVNAAKVCVITGKYQEVNGMPYVDYWHHLLDSDFAEISNGSVTTMWNEPEYEEENAEDFESDGVVVSKELFLNLRKMIFKEIAQYPYYKGEIPEEIEFHIWW